MNSTFTECDEYFWSMFVMTSFAAVRVLVSFIKATENIRWVKYWNPRLYVDNCAGDPKETVWHSVLFNSRQEAFAVERRRLRGSFIDNLALSQFPFDTQVK
jgi:hypothetical protein